jgi:hypothetical protein
MTISISSATSTRLAMGGDLLPSLQQRALPLLLLGLGLRTCQIPGLVSGIQ